MRRKPKDRYMLLADGVEWTCMRKMKRIMTIQAILLMECIYANVVLVNTSNQKREANLAHNANKKIRRGMKAKIVMVVDEEKYVYGIYPFETDAEKNKVNELAMRLKAERGIYVYVEAV